MQMILKLCVLGLIVSVAPLAAQSARGTAPRGTRGNNNDVAQARQQIQANKKAAIDQANAMYRLAMTTAQADAKSADAGSRARAQSEIQLAQSSRKAAIERANATAKSAMAALNSK